MNKRFLHRLKRKNREYIRILLRKLVGFFRVNMVFNEDKIVVEKKESIQLKNLEEENRLLREIINRAAMSITEVVQVEGLIYT
jgi:hypothetical protein